MRIHPHLLGALIMGGTLVAAPLHGPAQAATSNPDSCPATLYQPLPIPPSAATGGPVHATITGPTGPVGFYTDQSGTLHLDLNGIPYSGEFQINSGATVGEAGVSAITAGSSVSPTLETAVNGVAPITYSQSAALGWNQSTMPAFTKTEFERPVYQINLMPQGCNTPAATVNADVTEVEVPTVFDQNPAKLTQLTLSGSWSADATIPVSAAGNAVPSLPGVVAYNGSGPLPPSPSTGGTLSATTATLTGTATIQATAPNTAVTVTAQGPGGTTVQATTNAQGMGSVPITSLITTPPPVGASTWTIRASDGTPRAQGPLQVVVSDAVWAPLRLSVGAPATARVGQTIPLTGQLGPTATIVGEALEGRSVTWSTSPAGTLRATTSIIAAPNGPFANAVRFSQAGTATITVTGPEGATATTTVTVTAPTPTPAPKVTPKVIPTPKVTQAPSPNGPPTVTPTPKVTPKVTVKPQPKVTPKPLPKVTPKVTPKVMPKVMPKAIPTPTPKVQELPTPTPTPKVTPKVTVKPQPKVTPKVQLNPIPKVQPKRSPTPVVVPNLALRAPAKVYVGETIPVSVLVTHHGQPDVHAVVQLTASAGVLSQSQGTTNGQGRITVAVTHAPVGQVTVQATSGKAHGQALTHVIPRPATPFPWWIVGVLIGLLLLLLLLLAVRRRRRQDEPESTDSPESPESE